MIEVIRMNRMIEVIRMNRMIRMIRFAWNHGGRG